MPDASHRSRKIIISPLCLSRQHRSRQHQLLPPSLSPLLHFLITPSVQPPGSGILVTALPEAPLPAPCMHTPYLETILFVSSPTTNMDAATRHAFLSPSSEIL